jgi:hypothetical protein
MGLLRPVPYGSGNFRLWRLVFVQIKIDTLPLSSSCTHIRAHMYVHLFRDGSHSC